MKVNGLVLLFAAFNFVSAYASEAPLDDVILGQAPYSPIDIFLGDKPKEPPPSAPDLEEICPCPESKPFSHYQLLEENLAPSYITFGGGRSFGPDYPGKINSDTIFYEAEINTHFLALALDKSPGSANKMRLYIPVRFQVRQFSETSSPVKTPSFNPGARLFFWPKSWQREDTFKYVSAGFHHYSNGQNGDFFNTDGTINTDTGSFSTDYLEFSYYHISRFLTFDWYKITWQKHLDITWEDEQDLQYETSRIELSLRSKKFKTAFKQKVVHKYTVTLGYKNAGRDYIVLNPVTPSQNIEARVKDNIQFKYEHTFYFPALGSMGLYLRYDYGYDYYNINFQNRMRRIQFGLVGYTFENNLKPNN